jgi:putative oxidoreductase
VIKQFFDRNKNFGLLILRIGVGISFFLVHGLPKIQGGPALWEKLGGSMGNLGIDFAPMFWGFMAAASEFGGGLLLILGLFTRTSSAFLAFTMLVAAANHLSAMDPWGRVFHPIEMMVVFIALIFLGAGKYSIDALMNKNKAQI